MYFSGAWRGYWEQAIFGRQRMHDLMLHFTDGHVTGTGYDCIGAFTFVGEYDEHGAVELVKHYVGKHTVHYAGRYDGEGTIYGHWNIGTKWTGPFALSPEKFDAAEMPILTIAANPSVSA